MDEIWRDIPNYEGLYQASNLGRVRGLDRYSSKLNDKKVFIKGKIIKPIQLKNGRVVITLCKKGTPSQHTYTISRLVYSAFNSEFDYNNRNIMIMHKDGNKTNNNIDNLKEYSREYIVSKNKSKKVICIVTGAIFNSMIEASNNYATSLAGIRGCCIGKFRYSGKLNDGTKLSWMYYDEYLKLTDKDIKIKIHNINNIDIDRYASSSKKVICATTKKVFNSISEASRYYNISISGISACCSKKNKSAGRLEDGIKLVWEYID